MSERQMLNLETLIFILLTTDYSTLEVNNNFLNRDHKVWLVGTIHNYIRHVNSKQFKLLGSD